MGPYQPHRGVRSLTNLTTAHNALGTQAPVFHHVSRPIALDEFRDAVLATCRPRFPTARFARPQRIALAISGGVDSMAMAFLFSSLLMTYRGIKIGDNPVERAYAIVVDHRLREASHLEAASVCQELKKLGVKPMIRTLSWRQQTYQGGLDANSASNVESLARSLRYKCLGSACRYLRANSLFFAHHRDDQYETVLMRLLAGHGYRGLVGIREANAIPECYELHGVYKSGLLDDQMRRNPLLSFKPALREMKGLRLALKDAKDAEPWDQIATYLGSRATTRPLHPETARPVPYLAPLHSEDGGVMVYRPLLEFDKDRLRATCEANNVSWFEDATNRDPSLTTRNAIRLLTATHELPKALQKPAILALAKRAKTRSLLEEADAHRMLVREAVIKDFDPNAGTLLVKLPTFRGRASERCRWSGRAREAARRPQRRRMAAMAIRKLIDFVTPHNHLPPLANLENVVDRLFPELCLRNRSDDQPKAFAIAGVLFELVARSEDREWFLSRAPYTSSSPPPERNMPGYLNYRHGVLRLEKDAQASARPSHWRSWKTAKIWDGRFWIRVSARVAAKIHVLPFMPSYSKPFRKALPRKDRDRFEDILKHYAPGKVRYSLPALYSVEGSGRNDDQNAVLTLLALPSLGIHVPGLERWVRYEARYKQVDVSLLGPWTGKRDRTSPVGYARRHARPRRRQFHV